MRRAVEEREDSLHEEFTRILKEKLAEQFENFSRFNHDYISRQLKESQWDCKDIFWLPMFCCVFFSIHDYLLFCFCFCFLSLDMS